MFLLETEFIKTKSTMKESYKKNDATIDADRQVQAETEVANGMFRDFTCRICLFSDQNNVKIFGSNPRKSELVDKISRHLSIQVTEEDEFPKWICKCCLRSLESFHNFYSKVKQIQESLNCVLDSVQNSPIKERHVPKSVEEKIQKIESTIGFGRNKKRRKTVTSSTSQAVRRSNRERKSKALDDFKCEAFKNSDVNTLGQVNVKKEPEEEVNTVLDDTDLGTTSEILPNPVENSSIFPKEDDASSLEDQDWVGQGFSFPSDVESHGSDTDNTFKSSLTERTSKSGESKSAESGKRKSRKRKKRAENANGNNVQDFHESDSERISDDNEVQPNHRKTKLRITATHGTLPKPKVPPATRKVMRAQINSMMVQFYGFTCDICASKEKPGESSIKYPSFQELCAHMLTNHNDRGYVKCCNCKMRERKRAERHMLLHTQPGSIYKCNLCGKQLSSHQSFRSHILLHLPDSERPYQCNQCKRGFVSKSDLAQHERQHLPDDKRFSYTCDICGHRFGYESGLLVHKQRVHDNIRRHLCDLCAKSFSSRSDMERHREQIHGNVKREQCSECGKWFKGKSILKTHMRQHRGALFECPYCEKTYTVRSSWKAHLLRHSDEKPHQCPVCQKSFKLAGTLKMHLNQHTGDLPYACPFCPKKFASSGNYYTHRKRMHSEEVAQLKEATEAALASNGIPPDLPPATTTQKLSDALAKVKKVASSVSKVPRPGLRPSPLSSSNIQASILSDPVRVSQSSIAQCSEDIPTTTSIVKGNNSSVTSALDVSMSPISVTLSRSSNGTLYMTPVSRIEPNATIMPVTLGSLMPDVQIVSSGGSTMKLLDSHPPISDVEVVVPATQEIHTMPTTPILCSEIKSFQGAVNLNNLPQQESGTNTNSLQGGGVVLPQTVDELNAELNLMPAIVN